MTKNIWFFLVIVVAVAMRIFTVVRTPSYILTADTYTYFLTAQNIARTGVLTDPWRPPVFPLVFNGVFALSGHDIRKADFFGFVPEFIAFRLIQHVAGVVSVVLLFYFLVQAGMPLWFVVLSTGIIAIDPFLLAFERTILTETFSITLVMGILVLTQSLFKRYTLGKLFALAAIGVVCTLLRPAIILLPALLIGLVAWHSSKRLILVRCLAGVLAYTLTLGIYAVGNKASTGYLGISRISDINIFGKVLVLHIPITAVADVRGMKARIITYWKLTKAPDPFEFLRTYPWIDTPKGIDDLAVFSRRAILASFPFYLTGIVKESPGALVAVSQAAPLDVPGDVWFVLIRQGMRIFMFFYWLTIPGIFFVLYRLFRHGGITSWSMLTVAITCVYIFTVTLFLTYGDYGRHLLVITPLMIVFSLWTIWQGIRTVLGGQE